MCGIFGVVSRNEISDLAVDSVQSLLEHRGPDGRGLYKQKLNNTNVLLGHQRLSIIDLSENGHQPQTSADDRFIISFNGEIYNYIEIRHELEALSVKTKTKTDTEVLLNAWGTWGVDCLSRLQGMFAFVVFDKLQGTLTFARDPYGIKPLYYAATNDSFVFASEIDAVLMLSDDKHELNISRSFSYLTTGLYDIGEQTFYNDVLQLLPGHVLTIQADTLETVDHYRWYILELCEDNIDFEVAVTQIREVFLDSVRLHLRSDVPHAIALSGGLDSSAIACAVRYLEPEAKLHTFSYISENSDQDESHWVDLVNKEINAISHKVVISEQDFENKIQNLIKTQGEPFGGSSIFAQYCTFESVMSEGFKVTLDGQGADELFGGYDGYVGQNLNTFFKKKDPIGFVNFLINWARSPRRNIKSALKSFLGQVINIRTYSLLTRIGLNQRVPSYINRDIFRKRHGSWSGERFRRIFEHKDRKLVEALSSALTYNNVPTLMRHADRNSMAFSIESRVPFLEPKLVQLVMSQSERFLVSDKGETKYVLREALRGIVPNEIIDRKDKIGFATPQHLGKNYASRYVLKNLDNLKMPDLLKHQEVKLHFEKILNGSEEFTSRSWRLFNFLIWYQNAF